MSDAKALPPSDGGIEPGSWHELAPIDLLLRQGSLQAQAQAWQRAANEPHAMLAMADTVALVGQFRTLQTEASPTFGIKLGEVVARAERRLLPPPSRWQGWPWGVAAAAVGFLALQLWDPLRQPAPVQLALQGGERLAVETPATLPVVLDSREVAWQTDVETMRRRLDLESSTYLRQALEAGLGSHADPLGGWLDPRNALMRMRLDHELRASETLRQEALRQQGVVIAVDQRVQQLADAIGEQVLDAVAFGTPAIESVAMGLRALLAAGPGGASRQRAVEVGSGWLAKSLAFAGCADHVHGLAALIEVSAVTGDHRREVGRQGERLLASVLAVDGENWSRRLPDLLGARVRAGVLAEASRVLQRLPAFGIDAGHCAIVRQLLLGPLRERRGGGEDSPELVAALLYGCADLLGSEERERLELQLRRWKPVNLVADLPTVQQMAWSLEPGRRGFTRYQAELRQLAVCEDPRDLGKRGAFCLCLATDYAAFAGGMLSRLAGGS